MTNGTNTYQCEVAGAELPMSMSPCGHYFAIASLVGQLNVWDTCTSNLVAKYVPSQHLSTSCTKISWPPDRSFTKKSKNQFNSTLNKHHHNEHQNHYVIENELKKLSLLAMGTENGTIFLFSVHKNEIYSILMNSNKADDNSGGHSEPVNDICWLPEADSIFSCSQDHFVIEWSILEVKIKRKTMLDHSSSAITSICALDLENLITASNLLKWWNWPRKQLLRTFNGHSTEVRFLRPILFFGGNLNKDDEDSNLNFDHKAYLLSSAVSDRYINLWKLDRDSSVSSSLLSANSLASFLLDEEPISLEISHLDYSNTIFILSVSKGGYFYLFEHSFESLLLLSSSPKKFSGTVPLAPKFRLEIQTRINASLNSNIQNSSMDDSGKQTPKNKWKRSKLERMIPFLYAHLEHQEPQFSETSEIQVPQNMNKNIQILMIYGQTNRPTFERINIQECEKLCQQSSSLSSNHHHCGTIIKDCSILKSMDLLSQPTVVNLSTNTKIKSVKPSDRTTVIGPAGMVPHQPLFNNINGMINSDDEMFSEDDCDRDLNTSNSKIKNQDFNNNDEKLKKLQKAEDSELTFDEQLRLLENKSNVEQPIDDATLSSCRKLRRKNQKQYENQTEYSSSAVIINESLVNVLVQGLQSNDSKMLSTVLKTDHPDTVITNTVKKLSIEHVPRLLVELEKGLVSQNIGNAGGGHHSLYLKWITLLLRHKISYLMTIPNISEEFLPLNQLLQARTAMLEKCFQLKGRLDLILTQAKSNEFKNEKLSYSKPKFTYESESSESSEDDNDDEDLEDEDGEMFIDDNDLMESDNDQDQDNDDDESEISNEDSENENLMATKENEEELPRHTFKRKSRSEDDRDDMETEADADN